MSDPNFAVLKDKKVIPVKDVMEWAKMFEGPVSDRIVAHTDIGDIRVSTVFIGMNHRMGGPKDLWFETMVFGGPLDGQQWRCETYEEAESDHKEVIELVKSAGITGDVEELK